MLVIGVAILAGAAGTILVLMVIAMRDAARRMENRFRQLEQAVRELSNLYGQHTVEIRQLQAIARNFGLKAETEG